MAAWTHLHVTLQYIACAADTLCRFRPVSVVCISRCFISARHLLRIAVSASETEFAVHFPDCNCKLCFEHFCNLSVSGFVKWASYLVTLLGVKSLCWTWGFCILCWQVFWASCWLLQASFLSHFLVRIWSTGMALCMAQMTVAWLSAILIICVTLSSIWAIKQMAYV